jgi:hypothetical protein
MSSFIKYINSSDSNTLTSIINDLSNNKHKNIETIKRCYEMCLRGINTATDISLHEISGNSFRSDLSGLIVYDTSQEITLQQSSDISRQAFHLNNKFNEITFCGLIYKILNHDYTPEINSNLETLFENRVISSISEPEIIYDYPPFGIYPPNIEQESDVIYYYPPNGIYPPVL